jgi:hypothetical protein
MSSYRVVGAHAETDEERALREWFSQQVLASPSNLEEAARLLIGLVTGLLGLLFTVLAVAANLLPAYLNLPLVRGLGAAVVVLLLLSLIAALLVVIPWRWTFNPAQPASEAATFARILGRKSTALTFAASFFGLGLIVLGMVLVIALAT